MWVESRIVYLRKIIATDDRMILDKNHQNIFIQVKWVPVLYLRIMTVIDNSLCSSQRIEQSNVFQQQEMAKVQMLITNIWSSCNACVYHFSYNTS